MLHIAQNEAQAIASATPARSPTRRSGRWFAHNGLSKVRRAFLAADLAAGKVELAEPTLRQAALIAGVSVPYVVAARRVAFSQPHLRSSVEYGQRPLLETGRMHRPRCEQMAELWAAATPQERVAFIKQIGCDAVFAATVEAA
jgi:hypothetical protein